jgi:hypothetical protein
MCDMLGSLFGLIGGWREVKAYAGYSYQVSRRGRRRVVPIEGYRKRGLADLQWVETGKFAEDGLSERFKNYQHQPRKPKRQRLAKMDYALTR